MNEIERFKHAYTRGELTKPQFIEAMAQLHQSLHAYSNCLDATNIAGISIRAGSVTAEFSDPPIKMTCPSGDARIPPIEAFNFGDYEHEELQMVKTIVKILGGNDIQFLDIGANAGYYSLALSAWFPGIHGIAFEPVPKTFDCLQENFDANQVTNILPVNVGLSDQTANLKFYTYSDQSAAASMSDNLVGHDATIQICRVVPLDEYVADQTAVSVDFVKCDVEGAELLVFKGGQQTLKSHRPVVFSEMLRKWCAQYDYHPNQIVDFFAEIGYQCFVVRGGQLELTRGVTEDTVDTNFIFLHSDKHAALVEQLTA